MLRAQLYKSWITLSNGYIAIQRISDSKTYCVIHRIEIYPVDSVIRPSNNRGLEVIANIDVSFQHHAQQLLEGVSAIRLSKLPQLI